jgi:hypothetical protein
VRCDENWHVSRLVQDGSPVIESQRHFSFPELWEYPRELFACVHLY